MTPDTLKQANNITQAIARIQKEREWWEKASPANLARRDLSNPSITSRYIELGSVNSTPVEAFNIYRASVLEHYDWLLADLSRQLEAL